MSKASHQDEPGSTLMRIWQACVRSCARVIDRMGLRWDRGQDALLSSQVVLALLGGFVLAAATAFWRPAVADPAPAASVSVIEGEAIGAGAQKPGVPFSFEIPVRERNQVAIQLKFEGEGRAVASVVLLRTGGGAVEHEIRLEANRWVAWSVDGDFRRLLIDETSPANPAPARVRIRVAVR